MITYVINTSENKTFDRERGVSQKGNKTFDSSLLFELAGYSKIRWMYCRLEDIDACAEKIIEEQNKLTYEGFRVAVILDFYNYDLIRVPFSRDEGKVDAEVYKPFLETYLVEHLYDPIINRGYPIASCEVYYIQRRESGGIMSPANQKEQDARVFMLDGEAKAFRFLAHDKPKTEPYGFSDHEVSKEELELGDSAEASREACREVLKKTYPSFTLYLSHDQSLEFDVWEYCGVREQTFEKFLEAVHHKRLGFNSTLHRRHYYTTAGGSVSAAYDNLALSLYLVSAYEGKGLYENDATLSDEELDASVKKMDRLGLETLLLESYKKVHTAKDEAIGASSRYYSLDRFRSADRIRKKRDLPTEEEKEEDESKPSEDLARALPFEEQYQAILDYAAHKGGEHSPEAEEELGALMESFLKKRDANSIDSKKEEIENNNNTHERQIIDFPRDSEYEELITERRKRLQKNLSAALEAEYVEVDFAKEKERADVAYEQYISAKADMKKNLLGDISLILVSILSMLIPYIVLQHSSEPFAARNWPLYGIAAVIFLGVMIVAFIAHLLPILARMQRAEQQMRDLYNICVLKHRKSFAKLKARYQNELPEIEDIRFEIRLIEQLRQENININRNLDTHKVMLEAVEVCLKTMMNNLNIPIRGDVQFSGDLGFDPERPIMSPQNKVYQIFSQDAIEGLFRKKGGV